MAPRCGRCCRVNAATEGWTSTRTANGQAPTGGWCPWSSWASRPANHRPCSGHHLRLVDRTGAPLKGRDGWRLARAHASHEGNALAVCSRLGLGRDLRAELLAEPLVRWQWPDGGWNCDRRATGRYDTRHRGGRRPGPIRAISCHPPRHVRREIRTGGEAEPPPCPSSHRNDRDCGHGGTSGPCCCSCSCGGYGRSLSGNGGGPVPATRTARAASARRYRHHGSAAPMSCRAPSRAAASNNRAAHAARSPPLSRFRDGGAPDHWYAWDIGLCWINVVVGAGVFTSAGDALGEWRDAVGPATSGAALSPCAAGLTAHLLAPGCGQAPWRTCCRGMSHATSSAFDAGHAP